VHVPFSYLERGDEIHPKKEDGSMLIDPTTDHVAVWKVGLFPLILTYIIIFLI
jgi:hypothetical protein